MASRAAKAFPLLWLALPLPPSIHYIFSSLLFSSLPFSRVPSHMTVVDAYPLLSFPVAPSTAIEYTVRVVRLHKTTRGPLLCFALLCFIFAGLSVRLSVHVMSQGPLQESKTS
mmetsp:Transcript_18124/g.35622  ORF Transcript_18124/g.35622 Transcript_18124/m.35622 type:complete len:113 (-) Transcript_18124:149-487(-)